MSGYTIPDLIQATQALGLGGDKTEQANQILYQYQQDENNWTLAPEIISSHGTPNQLKTWAVITLKMLVQKRWGQIQDSDRQQVSGFLFDFIISYTGQPEVYQPLLDEADLALVFILIQEWPTNYTSFFQDIIQAGEKSEAYCTNSIKLIDLFCQHVLEDDSTEIPYAKSVELSNNLQSVSGPIYSFLERVITSGSEDTDMISHALSSLKYFFRWLDPKEIVTNQIFQSLCSYFLPNQAYVTPVLELFYDLFSNDLPPEIMPIVPQIFALMVQAIDALFSGNMDIDFRQFGKEFTRFLRILPMTLSAFILRYVDLLETPECLELVQRSLMWLCNLMLVDDEDILKTCADFWLNISRRYHKNRTSEDFDKLNTIYGPLFPVVRRRLIERMQEPEEHIKIQNDETGMMNRERRRNTVAVILHSAMKECLAILTTIDPVDTLAAIQGLMEQLSEWDPDVYDRLCWSVGAISKTLSFDDEKTFIAQFIRQQLEWCNSFADPDDRCTVARGVMYVCSQYPRFLSHFPQFLIIVTKKLFEFMGQDLRDIKEMAVMSFKTIAEKCSRIFISPLKGLDLLYIMEVIEQYPSIIEQLPPDLRVVFFDALSYIVNSNNRDQAKREQLELLLTPLNQEWGEFMNAFQPNLPELAIHISVSLNCNAAIASNVKSYFYDQFNLLFQPMMNIYGAYSAHQNEILQQNPVPPAAIEENRQYNYAKSSIIGVIRAFITKTSEISSCRPFLEPICDVIINSYDESHPFARSPEVLNLVNDLFLKMRDDVSALLPQILGGIFQSTNGMINTTGDAINDPDFESYMQFRFPFFNLLDTLVANFLADIIVLSEGFQLVMQAIQFGYSHPFPDCCEKSLDAVIKLLNNIEQLGQTNPQIAYQFSENYYLLLVFDMFRILTDTLHKFAFDKNIEVLARLLKMKVKELNPENVAESIIPLFQDKDQQSIFEFVCGLISTSNNTPQFKQIIRDFLVFTRTFKLRDPDMERAEIEQQNQENQEYLEHQVLDNNEVQGFEYIE